MAPNIRDGAGLVFSVLYPTTMRNVPQSLPVILNPSRAAGKLSKGEFV